MAEETQTKQTPAERMAHARAFRGKPRTRQTPVTREPVRSPVKMRAKPNWEDMSDMSEGPDRLRIPTDVLNQLRSNYGMDVQWVTTSVYGRPEPQRRAQFEKRGWTPVHQEDFDGLLDGLFMQRGADGEINMEGLTLVARPKELSDKSRAKEKREAQMPVAIKEQQINGGDIPGVTGANHPSVRNSVKRELERIDIPED